MEDKKFLRILVTAIIFLLILNLVFLALKIINEIFFWVIIAIAAIFAYKILPKMKRK